MLLIYHLTVCCTPLCKVSRVLEEFHSAGKPQALCCISPVVAAKVKKINLAGLALSCLSHVILSKVLGSKGVSLTLGNQGSEADWPYQGSIEAAKVTLVPWSHQYLFFFRALAQTWS